MQQTITNTNTDRTMKKITFGAVVLALLGIAAILTLSGCATTASNSTGSTVTEKYDSNGKVTEKTTTNTTASNKSKESAVSEKTIVASGSVSGIDIETSASSSGSNVTPTGKLGLTGATFVDKPSDSNEIVIAYSQQVGVISQFKTKATSFNLAAVGPNSVPNTTDGEGKATGKSNAQEIGLKQVFDGFANVIRAQNTTITETKSSDSTKNDDSSDKSNSGDLTDVAITSSVTAEPGNNYIASATTEAIVIKLPASPSENDKVGYDAVDVTKGVTVNPNGQKIGDSDAVLTLAKGDAAILTYTDGVWVSVAATSTATTE